MKHGIPVALRFWSKVRKLPGPNACWEWQGALIPETGYGQFKLGGKPVATHRYAYETRVGPIPPGLLVCHSCDNRKCVRPDHLFLGTYEDNMRDMAEKGRARAKLSEDDVREIRKLGQVMSPSAIAKRYGVAQSTIRFVLDGRTWKHVK
jgi:hypothetical protein